MRWPSARPSWRPLRENCASRLGPRSRPTRPGVPSRHPGSGGQARRTGRSSSRRLSPTPHRRPSHRRTPQRRNPPTPPRPRPARRQPARSSEPPTRPRPARGPGGGARPWAERGSPRSAGPRACRAPASPCPHRSRVRAPRSGCASTRRRAGCPARTRSSRAATDRRTATGPGSPRPTSPRAASAGMPGRPADPGERGARPSTSG